ncbi:GIY-YIG nuclease family protein [Candidatus Berkelbacteria bacterium]|nr:GIY-YIG nuclease family protein [Candidatus Berkelbacteria bacterium]
MTYIVYVLRHTSGRHYVGSTNDLVRRLSEHNRGQTQSTRREGKWEIVHTEHFQTSKGAKRREREIKSYKGGSAFKRLLTERE